MKIQKEIEEKKGEKRKKKRGEERIRREEEKKGLKKPRGIFINYLKIKSFLSLLLRKRNCLKGCF